MRVTRAESEQNRQRILDAAGRLFRERGIDGVGVADLMSAAGFTHGGFYNHFASKDALVAETCGRELTRANGLLAEQLADGKPGRWRRYIEGYLSAEQRDAPQIGCTLAALAGDASRQSDVVQAPFAENVELLIAILAAYLVQVAGDDGKASQRSARERAIELVSEMIGAMALARAVARCDPALSDEILATNRRKLIR